MSEPEIKKIILASSSPRRQELLRLIGLPFVVRSADVDEEAEHQPSPARLVHVLSMKKAKAVAKEMGLEEEALIIAADTVVSIHGKVLGKPGREEDAIRMLELLQGNRHTVYTGVTLLVKTKTGCKSIRFVEKAHVYMRKLTPREISAYVKTGEPFDKAGAYGIQGIGALWIEKIAGDYYTVMGLPLAKLYHALNKLGVDVKAFWPEPPPAVH